MNNMNFFEKEKGFLKYQKDNCWGGYKVDFDRRIAYIYPSIASPVNLGVSFVTIEQRGEKASALKIREAFHSRKSKIIRRMKDMGKRGIKSLFTKGIRWAIDTAFGIEEDMKVTEFSGVFSFSDPTVISYEAFEVAKNVMMDFSDFEIKFWRVDLDKRRTFLKNGDMAVTILGGAGGFSDAVVNEMKKVKYCSDEGRTTYSALACVANYAWARRQIVKGIIEMSVFDTFGKSVRTRKICDMSLNIIYDNGQSLTHRKNAVGKFSTCLCKFKDEFVIVDNDSKIGRIVLIDE